MPAAHPHLFQRMPAVRPALSQQTPAARPDSLHLSSAVLPDLFHSDLSDFSPYSVFPPFLHLQPSLNLPHRQDQLPLPVQHLQEYSSQLLPSRSISARYSCLLPHPSLRKRIKLSFNLDLPLLRSAIIFIPAND